ncbi:MAG: clostripain-related cysteine peptidase [Eubacteriales bacterium]|nr:clostripain-related cysteine peptidase [Eubacteriales bacterium]
MKNSRIIKFAAAALMFAALLLLPSDICASAEDAKINVLVYMIGSDLESKDAAATENINEMRSASKNFGDDINFIVYGGGTKEWHNSIFSSKENRCVRFAGGRAELLYSEETRDMTEQQTLCDFIKYCAENYPADRSMIIMWDHGGGIRGFGADELHDYNDNTMSLPELRTAFEGAGTYFDIVGFDACMMAGYEAAQCLAGCAKYMVASEEMEPLGGWNYGEWLSALAENPEDASVEIGKKIVDTYIDWCRSNILGVKCALSVIDLELIDTKVSIALNVFCQEMLEELKEGRFDAVKVQQALYGNMVRANKVNMVDAIEFAESIENETGELLKETLEESVVYNRKYPAVLPLRGLLIYIPGEDSPYDSNTLREQGMGMRYLNWLTSYEKFVAYGKGEERSERTLQDVLKNRESKLDTKIYDAASRTRLDVTGCYITEDKNHMPVLHMPEEKQRLTAFIFQEVYGYKDGMAADYGCYYYRPAKVAGEKGKTWDYTYNAALYINDVLCPFYEEEITQLSIGRWAMYGYTPMFYNGDEGMLYLRLVCTDKDESVTIEPLCFQKKNDPAESTQYGRLIPAASLDGESTVCFGFYEYTGTDEDKPLHRLTADMKWKNVRTFEWKYGSEIDRTLTAYYALDLYNELHPLELKK